MCETRVYQAAIGASLIVVATQRDESLRMTEVVIINHNWLGMECQGMRVWCNDDGTIRGGVNLIHGVDMTCFAEMRG